MKKILFTIISAIIYVTIVSYLTKNNVTYGAIDIVFLTLFMLSSNLIVWSKLQDDERAN